MPPAFRKVGLMIHVRPGLRFCWRTFLHKTKFHKTKHKTKISQTWASAGIFPGGENVENLLMLFRLLTMQCKSTFTKRIALSNPLVCAGCTSILNLLSKMFSTLRLSEIHFLFISCPISIFWARAANCHNLRKINGQNNTCGEKTRNLDILAKLLRAMRSRNICWRDNRTTHKS